MIKTNLFDEINIYTESPLLLVGRNGSGKKTLVSYLSDKYNTGVKYINNTISDDTKSELYSYSDEVLIVFDLTSNLKVKQFVSFQNSILKILEDPPYLCKIIVLTEDTSHLLNTVKNRCNIRYIEKYSIDQLRAIAKINDNKNILDYTDDQLGYITYPIDAIKAPSTDELLKLENLIRTILSSIYTANISNILSISKKLDFSDVGYDINLFLTIFKSELVKSLKHEFNSKYFDIFKVFMKLDNNMRNPSFNKKNLLEDFLLTLKYI